MPFYTCDTSTIISRKLSDLPKNFLFSTVVLAELIAGAKDKAELRIYERLALDYERDRSLVTPGLDDWLLSSKILYWLTEESRRKARGRAPRLAPGVRQRMFFDALIATSAHRWKTTVITDNWTDFKAIQRYCKVRLVKGSDFFG